MAKTPVILIFDVGKTNKKVYTLNTNPDDHIVILNDDAEDFQARNFNLNSVIVLNGREKQEWG